MHYPTLKAYRALKNVTQDDMAEHLGLSVLSYNRKENGKVEFTLNEAKRMADYFGVTIDDLFFGREVKLNLTRG